MLYIALIVIDTNFMSTPQSNYKWNTPIIILKSDCMSLSSNLKHFQFCVVIALILKLVDLWSNLKVGILS